MPRRTHERGPPAKLLPPTLPKQALLARPRLFALLDRARRAPLVWVAAGPGAGKTTLLASYLPARRVMPLWVQLDASDSDPAMFFHLLRLGAELLSGRRRIALRRLRPEHLSQLTLFARRFFAELDESLPARTAIVLDNFGELGASSVVHELVRAGIDSLPSGRTLFVLSRSAPPSVFARTLAEQRVVVIEEAQLKLTLGETQRLATRQSRGARVAARQLLERTGGWLAGTVLLLKGTRDAAERSKAAPTTPELLAGYFSSEVLAGLDARARRVVVATALLPSMTAAMAEALSGEPSAGRVLMQLHGSGCFTECRPERPLRFQYHSLFREFLLDQLTATAPPDELRALRLRAAALLATDGQPDAALAAWAAAGEPGAAVELIVREAPNLLRDGRWQQLNAWITTVPEDLRRRTPWLQFWQGVALLATQPAEAQRLLEAAVAAFDAAGEVHGALLACAGVLDAIWYTWREPAALDRWCGRAAELVARAGELPPPVDAPTSCAMFTGLFWRRPGDPECHAWAERAEAALRGAREADFRITAAAVALSNLHIFRGALAGSRGVLRALEELLGRGPPFALGTLALFQTRAVIAVTEGDPDGALAAVAAGLALGREQGIDAWNVPLLGVQVMCGMLMGDIQLARRTVDEMFTQSRDAPLHFRSWIFALQSWVEREVGNTYAARAAAEASLELAQREGPFPEVLPRLALAALNEDLGQPAKADAELARALEIARQMDSTMVEIAARLVAARIAFVRGAAAAGRRELQAAFGLGAASGLVEWQSRVTRAELASLCAEALAEGIEPEYAKLLIRARRLAPGPDAERIKDWPWPVKIYTLGRFSVVRDGRPVSFSHKAQKRPLDLLKVLIALGGRQVSQTRILEELWPHGKAAPASFDMALKRLRDLLGADALVRTERKLTLNRAHCWVDVWALERALKLGADDASRESAALYKGPFLRGETDVWCLPTRERVRAAFVRHVHRAAQALARAGRWAEAADWYADGLNADDLAEPFYRELMRCYVALDRRAEALGVFRRCCRVLDAQLGIAPSAATVTLSRSIAD